MKRLICTALSIIMAASALVSCGVAPRNSRITSSAELEPYADFLEARLGEKLPDKVHLLTDDGSTDMSEFEDDGYITRARDGDVVIIGKTAQGVERGVRDFASNGNSLSYEKIYHEGYRVKKLTLAGYDISEYTVVIPEDADANVNYAAELLCDYIKKACGAVLPVSNSSAEHEIRFTPDTEGSLGDEGFTIETADGQMTVTHGRYRGAAYGAIEFLEAYVGWRFLYKPYSYRQVGYDGAVEYLYVNDDLVIPSGISDTQTPSIIRREVYGDLFGESDYADLYCYKTKYNGEGAERDPKFGCYNLMRKACHGLANEREVVNYVNEAFEDRSGQQPCFTDEDFIEFMSNWIIRKADNSVKSGSVIGYDLTCIDVAGFDTTAFCACQDCRKIVEKEGTNAGPLLSFTNIMADVVNEKYPGLYVSTLAYYGCNKPPKKMVPRENVQISYCFYIDPSMAVTTCGAHPFDGSECPEGKANAVYSKQFEKWCEITTKVSVWYYQESYYPVVPACDFDMLYKNMKYLADNNTYGIFFLTGALNGGGDFCALRSYMAQKLMWNAYMSEEEYQSIIREYFLIMYGEDSGENMYEYFTMMSRSDDCLPDCYNYLYSKPFKRYREDYYRDNYKYMIELFDEAYELAPTAEAEDLVSRMKLHMDFMGISANWENMYVNGAESDREFIQTRYRNFWEDAVKYNLFICDVPKVDRYFPTENMDFTKNPYDYLSSK